MIPVAQTKLRPPDGNCYAACIASILELPLDSVPNVAHFYADKDFDGAWVKIQSWLRPIGLALSYVEGDQLQAELDGPSFFAPGYWIATHEGLHGVAHCTVWKNGKMVWNPYPGRHDSSADLGEVVMAEWFVTLDPALLVRNLGGRWRRAEAARRG